MYVSWDDFATLTLGYVVSTPNEMGEDNPESVKPDYTQEEYMRLAPLADAIIDEWTLDRVGRAVRNGEELPEIVRTLYVAIIENLPAVIENGKVQTGGLVSSFSNGIDSYSFDVDSSVRDELKRSIGWMLDLLPVEWISQCVYFEGGNKYAG